MRGKAPEGLLIMGLPARFWVKTRIEDTGYETPCITWIAYRLPNGYGRVGWNGKTVYAHRLAYEVQVGPIPVGLVIDHLCRNRACVNVSHMEPVTNQVNILRGETVPAAMAAKTQCDAGHLFDEANTIWVDDGNCRRCLACDTAKGEARNARRRAETAAEIAARTHCGKGHVLAEVGTYGPYRSCMECARDKGRRGQAVKKGDV